jgi:CelD/BcsL family acetyltransferase involved in cellulose biosynthesis
MVNLPESWQQYLKRLSSKERGKVGIRYRRLQNKYQLRLYRCETLKELPSCLEALFRLHRMRWEERGEPGSFALPQRRTFYYTMAGKLLERGWLDFWLLELDGQTVAAQIGLRYRDRVYALQEGFDPAYSKDSVGYVLRSQVLRCCIEAGAREYDFLAGDQDSKQRWGAEAGCYVDFHFSRCGSASGATMIAARRLRPAKDWLRGHLPEPLMRYVNSIRNKKIR